MTHWPLRTEDERVTFCDQYFQSVGAPLIREANGYREYELPRHIDKELTDRPYYWLWVEQTNQAVPPTVLRLAFSETALQRENERLRAEALSQQDETSMTEVDRMFFRPPTAELVTLGSFRLEKIFDSVEKHGQYACVAVVPPPTRRLSAASRATGASAQWVPWLMMNALVSYRCDSIQQEWRSLGICLENGQIVERFLSSIAQLPFTHVPSDALLSDRTLTLQTALHKAQVYLERHIHKQPTAWAEAAKERLSREKRQLETYYESLLPDMQSDERQLVHAEMTSKLRQLQERTEPRVELDIKQLALVGLIAP